MKSLLVKLEKNMFWIQIIPPVLFQVPAGATFGEGAPPILVPQSLSHSRDPTRANSQTLPPKVPPYHDAVHSGQGGWRGLADNGEYFPMDINIKTLPVLIHVSVVLFGYKEPIFKEKIKIQLFQRGIGLKIPMILNLNPNYPFVVYSVLSFFSCRNVPRSTYKK
jgi:hypothetical protein